MRVIIFDYDDTLFPSSHVAKHNLYKSQMNSTSFVRHREAFQELETAAISMLSKAIAVGDLVVIVTNGKLDWIKYSLHMFYHRFFDFVRKNETPIVSAQDIFGHKSPHPVVWKVSCFRQLLASLQSSDKIPTMLISIGDGSHEAIACEVTAREFGIRHRNVNLLETPSPQQMTQQLYLLAQELPSVMDIEDKLNHTDVTASIYVDECIKFHVASVNHCESMWANQPSMSVEGQAEKAFSHPQEA